MWKPSRRTLSRLVSLVTLVAGASSVRAGVWDEVAIGLGAAGFDIRGNNNPLSGGARLLVTNEFQGEVFDFGTWELALDGPISFDVSTGGRYLSVLDIALKTAVTGDANASPLDYRLTFDSGDQQTTITGNLLIDGDLEFNGFGYYDLNFEYSSRQTVVNDGSIDESEREFDADLGPINVRGNVFVDAIAAITAPIFEATGAQNPFESLSGAAQLKHLVESQVSGALIELAQPSARMLPEGVFGVLPNASDPSALPAAAPDSAGVVPEPTVLVLMLLGLPAILARPKRRRASGRAMGFN